MKNLTAKQRIKVLIIDDEIGIRELLSEILLDEGYAVVTAHDAASAQQMRLQEAPEIILLDIWMPDMDGISLLRQWAEAGFPNVPVIIMSGHATIDTAVEATRLGALEVLEKPITTTRLLQAVEKAKIKKDKQDSNLLLQQINFGSTLAMTTFKKELLQASAEARFFTLMDTINGGAVFYARFLVKPKSPVVILDSGTELEDNIGEIIRRAEDGVIIVRLVNVFNTLQQNGLLGLIHEANKSEARVVAISSEAPEILAERGEFNERLVALLSRRVVGVPSLSKCAADLPYLIDLICQRITKDRDMQKRKLTVAAKEELAKHHYEEDFSELVSIIRTIFLYAQSDTIELGTVRGILKELTGQSSMRSMFDEVYNMSLRDAREYFEREYFIRLINTTNGNMQQAAKVAGLERTYFYRKLKQYKAGDHNLENSN